MKLIINGCYGGFGVNDEIAQQLKLNEMDEDQIRTNPQLIATIESGVKVDDEFAELKVVELPDNCTDYYIDEYDGCESVIYVVDGKLHWA